MNMLNGRNSPEHTGEIFHEFAQALNGFSSHVPEEYALLPGTALEFARDALSQQYEPGLVSFCYKTVRKQLMLAA